MNILHQKKTIEIKMFASPQNHKQTHHLHIKVALSSQPQQRPRLGESGIPSEWPQHGPLGWSPSTLTE